MFKTITTLMLLTAVSVPAMSQVQCRRSPLQRDNSGIRTKIITSGEEYASIDGPQISLSTSLTKGNNFTFSALLAGGAKKAWIDLNGNKTYDQGEDFVSDNIQQLTNYKVDLPNVTIYGDLEKFDCSTLTFNQNGTNVTYDNKLVSIDLSRATNLRSFYCINAKLKHLDVSQNKNLSLLYCYNNNLSELNLSNNKALYDLSCNYNPIRNLDVSNLEDLFYLSCESCELSELDLSKLSNIRQLYCPNNRITSLDLSKLSSLSKLTCAHNQLKKLDVSNNQKLIFVSCSYNLIADTEMDNFIKGLDDAKLKNGNPKKLIIIDPADPENSIKEGNTCSKKNVQDAVAKSWTVGYWKQDPSTGHNVWTEYIPQETSIQDVRSGENMVRVINGALFISSTPMEGVSLYSLEGVLVRFAKADNNGEVSLSLDGLQKGIYVVKIGSDTEEICL